MATLEKIIDLPLDLFNVCNSYLSKHEQFYYQNKWNKLLDKKVFSIAATYGWLDLMKWAFIIEGALHYLILPRRLWEEVTIYIIKQQ